MNDPDHSDSNPTAENIAKYIYTKLSEEFSNKNVKVNSIKLWKQINLQYHIRSKYEKYNDNLKKDVNASHFDTQGLKDIGIFYKQGWY